MSRHYWRNIDILKGALLILVFVGHIIPGALNETLPRYLIYAFHMPLFVGISGLLIRKDTLTMPLFPLLKKYWSRMILPWIIAVACYLGLRIVTGDVPLSLTSLIKAYGYPYYHLWYIPAYLVWIIAARLLYRLLGGKWLPILAICATASVLDRLSVTYGIPGGAVMAVWHNDIRLYYLIFFVLGIWLRQRIGEDRPIPLVIPAILTVVCAAVTVVCFWWKNTLVQEAMFYGLNIPALLLMARWCFRGKQLQIRPLEFIGKYSLPIYLYHVICKMAAGVLFAEGTPLYYIAACALLAAGCAAIALARKVPFIDRWILGSTSSSLRKR